MLLIFNFIYVKWSFKLSIRNHILVFLSGVPKITFILVVFWSMENHMFF
jgi:hypothetical protein